MIGLEPPPGVPPQVTYKQALANAMAMLATDPARRFIGYGLLHGRAAGTLKGIPDEQILETPVAENLMVAMATGLSLTGLKPLVFIERCDFVLNALDALVNHLDKINLISRGQFTPAAIIRIVVGNRHGGLKTGATHIQNFGPELSTMLPYCVVREVLYADEVKSAYALAAVSRNKTHVILEYKDLL